MVCPAKLQYFNEQYVPGLGTSIGLSDPVFMARYGLQPDHTHSAFPYDPSQLDKKLLAGDSEAKKVAEISFGWMKEICSGLFHTWEDVAFLRKNWDGPIVLKGIQCPEVQCICACL